MACMDTSLVDTQRREGARGGSRVRLLGAMAGVLFAALGSVTTSSGSAVAAEAPRSSPSPDTPRSASASHGDPAKGAARADALFCAGCHGPNGRSAMPEMPSLAGQGTVYLEQQLRLMRSGERLSQAMAPIAASLTDDDIADLSAYYAAQSPRAPASSSSPASDPQAAIALYRNGDAARSIQACAACHGADGSGDAATMAPALRAQQAAYVGAQLEAYARRSRYQSTVPEGLQRAGLEAMYDVAHRLTDDEVRELAQYLQSLP